MLIFRKKLQFMILAFGAFYSISCNNDSRPKSKDLNSYKAPLQSINKKFVTREGEEIDNWLKRHSIQAFSTGTGLRYSIIKKGNGNQPKNGEVAFINYKISLLDGTVCYESEKNKPKSFVIGHDHVESGLHEGILLMHVGDKAVLIVPPHLAHGLLGDESKIPPLATLVFEIELLTIKG